VLLTFVYCVYLADRLPVMIKVVLITIGIMGIFMANYRTTVLAVIPVLLSYVALGTINRFVPSQRALMTILTIPVTALFMLIASEHLAERFADFGEVLSRGAHLIKPPNQWSQLDIKLLSGRLFIWARYIDGWAHGTDFQLLFGLGPNSWNLVFDLYAHNTLVSYLYEIGVFGVAAVLAIWTTFIVMTLKIPDPALRRSLLFAQAGFLILNMATMPHWLIEGDMLFGLLQGYVVYQVELARRQRAASPHLVPSRAAKPRRLPANVAARLQGPRPDYTL
jgi:hypothetical protein